MASTIPVRSTINFKAFLTKLEELNSPKTYKLRVAFKSQVQSCLLSKPVTLARVSLLLFFQVLSLHALAQQFFLFETNTLAEGVQH